MRLVASVGRKYSFHCQKLKKKIVKKIIVKTLILGHRMISQLSLRHVLLKSMPVLFFLLKNHHMSLLCLKHT